MTAKSTAVRLEGFSLPVSDVARSVAFYRDIVGLEVAMDHAPAFALVRGGPVTIGLLGAQQHGLVGERALTHAQRATLQIELTTDDLDALHAHLVARGVHFHVPPHDEPWERSMQAYDPDGYTIEWAQGRRGVAPAGGAP